VPPSGLCEPEPRIWLSQLLGRIVPPNQRGLHGLDVEVGEIDGLDQHAEDIRHGDAIAQPRASFVAPLSRVTNSTCGVSAISHIHAMASASPRSAPAFFSRL
jgi:hypothetical protein